MVPYPSLAPQNSEDSASTGRVMTAIELALIFQCLDQPLNLKLNERGAAALNSTDQEHALLTGLEAQKPGLITAVMHMNMAYDQFYSHSTATVQSKGLESSRTRKIDIQGYKKNNRHVNGANGSATDDMRPEFMPIGGNYSLDNAQEQPRDIFANLVSRFETASNAEQRLTSIVELVAEVSKMYAAGTIKLIPSDLVKTGLGVLEASSSSTDKRSEAARDQQAAEKEEEVLEISARAGHAVILLLLGSGPSVFSEDALLSAMSGLQSYLERVIIPAAERAVADEPLQVGADEEDGETFGEGRGLRTKLSASKATATKARRREHEKRRERAESECSQRAAPVAAALCWLADLVRGGPLQDRELLGLSHLCLTALFGEGGEALRAVQHAAIAALLAVFSRYPLHRRSLFEELFARIGGWRPTVRPEACYRLAAPASGHIQTLSALIFLLLQASSDLSYVTWLSSDSLSSFRRVRASRHYRRRKCLQFAGCCLWSLKHISATRLQSSLGSADYPQFHVVAFCGLSIS